MNLWYLAAVGLVLWGSLLLADEGVKFRHRVIDEQGPANMHTKSVGDFDSDGFADLLAAGTGGEIVWYEYPSWAKHTIATGGGGWSTDAETGDIDGDGDIDLVISDWYQTGRVSWFENPGSQGQLWQQHVIGGPRAHDIELADFDRDGDLDIVTRQQGDDGNRLEFWMQSSPAVWQHQSIDCPTGEGLTVADIDHDGDVEVVIPTLWFESSSSGGGGGELVWAGHRYTGQWDHAACAIQTGDINRDGRLDIVITPAERRGQSYRIAWYEAPQDPRQTGWHEHPIDAEVEAVLHSLGVADVTGDGRLDVVTAEMEQGADPDEVLVYARKAGGETWQKHVVAHSSSHSIRVVDIGGDGDFDIFGADWNRSRRVDLWENQLRGADRANLQPLRLDRWQYVQIDDARGERAFGLASADLTADGLADIAAGRYFYRNPGGDMAAAWTRTTFPVEVDVLLAVDVDGDEFGDLIGLDNAGQLYWLEAADRQGGSWQAIRVGEVGETDHRLSSQGYTSGQVLPGGRAEIVINVGAIYWFEIPPQPAGPWPRHTIAEHAYPEGVALGDVDGDGDLDLAGPATENRVAWWEQGGDPRGSWQLHVVGDLPSKYADRFYLVDLNGDQLRDIAVCAANGDRNGVYWWQQQPGRTWKMHLVAEQATTNSMDVADMDRDGDVDIIAGEHRGQERVTIFANDGQGNFTPHHISAGLESHLGTRVADFDGDGDLDIASIAWDDFRFLHFWRNDAVR